MPFKRARGERFFLKKHGFLGLTPVYSETTGLSKPYFILKLQSVKNSCENVAFQETKVDFDRFTMALKTPFFFFFFFSRLHSNFAVLWGIRIRLLVVKSWL